MNFLVFLYQFITLLSNTNFNQTTSEVCIELFFTNYFVSLCYFHSYIKEMMCFEITIANASLYFYLLQSTKSSKIDMSLSRDVSIPLVNEVSDLLDNDV